MTDLSNQLATSSSTYLLQHANNPVHWQYWSSDTLAYAKSHDRPILLSIGYAACHWCHVMAHESFENQAIANLMNQHFVNIKLDRQERPDLDHHFQIVHQLFTRRAGGWPLTVFIDPQDLTAFFAGTYFPPTDSRGMPGFINILPKLADHFIHQRSDLRQQSAQIRDAFAHINASQTSADALSLLPLKKAHTKLLENADQQYGGMGGAPKFPRCPELNLLQYFVSQNDADATTVLRQTLQSILDGGLYDHLGGGFFRYCVDQDWQIPHFEKMLYDNAQLLPLLAQQSDRLNGASAAIYATIQWLQRRLTINTPDGVLYAAALDADSTDEQGKQLEGAYYLWQPEQVKALLPEQSYADFAQHFGLNDKPNFEHEAWHLQGPYVSQFGSAKTVLLNARQRRHLPSLDQQALCSWNALLAIGLLRSGYALGDDQLINTGHNLIETLWTTFWQTDTHRLKQTYARQACHGIAFIDDLAALLLACVIDLQMHLSPSGLKRCKQLAAVLFEHHHDKDNGGFFMAATEFNEISPRSKPFTDDATPAGNGLACQALQKLAYLTGDSNYADAVEKTLALAQEDIQRYPTACATLLLAQAEHLEAPVQVLISGEVSYTEKYQWLKKTGVHSYFLRPSESWENNEESIVSHFAKLPQKLPLNIQICLGYRCLPICHTLDEAEKVLYKEHNK